MKTNKRVKESFYKMVSLDISKEKRKEYIKGVYSSFKRLRKSYGCVPGSIIYLSKLFTSRLLRQGLDELIKERASPEESVSRIEEIFNKKYRRHKSSPINDWL